MRPFRRPSIVVFACLAGLWLAIFPFLLATMGFRGDFLAFYTGAHLVWWGDLARLYERELYRAVQVDWVGAFDGAYRFVYPPAFTTYYLPLTAFSVDAARIVWVVAMGAALGVAARVSRRWHDLSGALMTLCILAFAGTYASFVVGQNSPLTLLLMAIVTLWTAFRPRPLLAGLAAGLLLYKPQLLLGLGVAWLAAPRRDGSWRSLAALLSTGGVWLLFSWILAPGATA